MTGFNSYLWQPNQEFSVDNPYIPGQFGQQFNAAGFNTGGMEASAVNGNVYTSTKALPVIGSDTNSGGGMFDNFNFGNAIQAGTGLVNAWTGIQNVQNARNALSEQKRQFNMNWEAQANLTNQQLEARRNRQIAAQGVNSGNGMTSQQFVEKYGVRT